MSMFDEVLCERVLPDGLNGSGITFQTKDLQDWPTMTKYTITAEGRLVRDEWHYEATPREKLPYPDATDYRAAFGCLTRVVDRPAVDQNYHGRMRFYEGIGGDPRTWEWHEYEATFTEGTLTKLEAVPA